MSTTSSFDEFTGRLREFIRGATELRSSPAAQPSGLPATLRPAHDDIFGNFARDLFELQFEHNPAYRALCEARQVSPRRLEDWRQIPAVPTSAFKELELTCLPITERDTVFQSSGTTAHRPSCHYHNSASLALYEDSLWAWFLVHFQVPVSTYQLAMLTPPPAQAPHSSLVHMFEVIRRRLGSHGNFFGEVLDGGTWGLDLGAVTTFLNESTASEQPVLLCGTAFSYVHLVDLLIESDLRVQLPPGSWVLETGGYKGRSRSLPKAELHSLITEHLGIPPTRIVSEYGMSELSSQAYDRGVGDNWRVASDEGFAHHSTAGGTRQFTFPPWARVQIVSPETGLEVDEGETGLIRVLDLANVYSVMGIQTEDLGIRRGAGFELIGRAVRAEARGCSLMVSA